MRVARKSLSKQLRFEIMKRDGHRCRYCGSEPNQKLLQVDHVIPVAKGGTDAPENLVTSCRDCNAGKGARQLDQNGLPASLNADAMLEQAQQIRAMLDAQRVLEKARDEVADELLDRWVELIGPASEQTAKRLRALVAVESMQRILRAIEATGSSKVATPHITADRFAWKVAFGQMKYFSAVLRNMRVECAKPSAETEGVGGGLDSGKVVDLLQNGSAGAGSGSVSEQKGREAVPPDAGETAIEQSVADDFTRGLRAINGRR